MDRWPTSGIRSAVAPSVIGYVRVSTNTQVTDGDGLGIQRDRIGAWCSYQGMPNPEVHEDAGISGTADDRSGLKAALRAALGRGSQATLVVYKLDRLGRNAIDVQEALAVLLDAGVRVVALADGVDSASGMGSALLKLLTSILATFAELEKEGIRVRLLDGRRRADAQDRVYASEPRYGRRVAEAEAGTLVVDDLEARAIVRIEELRAEGLSYRSIARVPRCRGVPPAPRNAVAPRRRRAYRDEEAHSEEDCDGEASGSCACRAAGAGMMRQRRERDRRVRRNTHRPPERWVQPLHLGLTATFRL